jgi:hypothetical protein
MGSGRDEGATLRARPDAARKRHVAQRAAPISGVKMVKLAELRAHPRNPRRHDRAELDDLKASFLAYGFTEPVVRQVSTGYIVAGNGRLTAALELAAAGKLDALEFTPGVKLNGCLPVVDKAMDDREALAYMIADNRLTERGTWDWPEVKAIMVEDLGLGPDVSALDLPTGFTVADLAGLMGNGSEPPSPSESRYKEQYGIIVACSSEADQAKKYGALKAAGYECKVVAT